MTRSFAVLLCVGVAFAAPYAAAQNPQPAPPGLTHAPVAPPSSPSPPPEKIAPPGKDVRNDQVLSDRLAEQQGVLHPPRTVDPGMQVTPPTHTKGTMPVIPPPGSPGGDQRVVPK
jgi:hypothetical protein